MKLKPLADRVLVRRLEVEEKTVGGIIIPDSAKEKPLKGEIIAAGPGKLDDNGSRVTLGVKEGDAVLFAKYAGTEISIEGVDYLIMREDDILAVVE
ncbi:co-chaperone GroES [Maridesulfovibrio sp.]|uniref:co-chaperone GroES n=1 Tax=Maridesulfovibrio sp. TaxID=2795000 RepID=UPI002A18BBCC|nr:co-chaperone GroES [Maridesulfovibrio sp.]